MAQAYSIRYHIRAIWSMGLGVGRLAANNTREQLLSEVALMKYFWKKCLSES